MEKRPFIIDCDTGTDDAIAILAALGSDAIRVRALTSVNGNVNENFTSRNNRDLVGYLGADVEVARGAKIPFYPRAGYYDATHGSEGLGDVMDGLLGGLDALGAGPLASWLSGRISGVVRGLGFEPVDLSCKKPVLTDSSNVIAQSDVAGLGDLQSALRSIPLGSTDPGAILQAAGYAVGERIYATEFTLASIPLPGGGSIPLTIRLGDLFKGW